MFYPRVFCLASTDNNINYRKKDWKIKVCVTKQKLPVSNIPSVAKLFKLYVLQRLEGLDMDELVSISQHGFRKQYSTDSAISELIGTTVSSIEIKNMISIYSADCVQGSILGPCRLISYADDSYVIAEAQNIEILTNLISLTMTRHFDWLTTKVMVCNLSKTELMLFGDETMSVQLNDITIESKSSMNVLGVTVDNQLKWENHVEKVVNKCRSFVFTLRYIRRFLNNAEVSKVIKAHVISRIAYASSCWSNFLRYNLKNKIKSVYFHILRVAQRDFDFNLNRATLLSRMDSFKTILCEAF